MEDIKEGYPLQWPLHWKRTPIELRQHSRFRNTFFRAKNSLLDEIRLLKGRNPVISSDVMLKRDGTPYANQKGPEDSGIAVYFELFGKQQCVPCDKWRNITDNLIAIEKTISALRGIERWGAKDMVEAAFRGFQALPAPDQVIVTQKQYFADCNTSTQIDIRYKRLSKELHPDVGGNKEEFIEMSRQYDQIKD